ncbi:MAG: hypothetical protein ACLQGP_38405 [Isosphaeraceae bacterium]
MFFSVLSFYFFIKIVFFYSLVRAQIKSDLIKDNWLFLGIFYTGAVAFLSFALIKSWQDLDWARWAWQIRLARNLGITNYQCWLGQTLALSTVYFRLMAKFDEGVIFWTLLLLGLPVAMF